MMENQEELKQNISQVLRAKNIYSEIRALLAENTQNGNSVSEKEIMELLKRKGVVQDILQALSSTSPTEPTILPHERKPVLLNLKDTYLSLSLLGGKAFLEHAIPATEPRKQSTFQVHLQFKNQRFHSEPVAAACEPAFSDVFFLKLQEREHETHLSSNAPIHVVLIKKGIDGENTLIGTQLLEWRKVLALGTTHGSIELVDITTRVTAGILNFRLELLPKTTHLIPEKEITFQINTEKKRETEALQVFFAYAKSWWKEYSQIGSLHEQRLVKIFAETEFGVDMPVCSFIQPIKAARLLSTPKHALRFVSLLEFNTETTAMPNSLLLGFGLDAYVCVGTDDRGATTWVMTISSSKSIVFWDCRTCSRIEIYNKTKYKYKTIESVFNHAKLYANNQITTSINSCIFELENPRYWKCMNQQHILSSLVYVSSSTETPLTLSSTLSCTLVPSVLDVLQAELKVEAALKDLIVEYRGVERVNKFDEAISNILSCALWTYEIERITGTTLPNDEFQDAIKRAVPEGHTFIGFPLQFSHLSPRRMMQAFTKAKVAHNIILSQGDQLKLAISVGDACLSLCADLTSELKGCLV